MYIYQNPPPFHWRTLVAFWHLLYIIAPQMDFLDPPLKQTNLINIIIISQHVITKAYLI